MSSSKSGSSGGDSRNIFDRVLPHSLEAERALLGSMLLERDAVGEALAVLQDAGGESFFQEKHQKLFDAIVPLYDANVPFDGVVIKNELVRLGVFDSLGGFDFLASLINSVPSALRVRHYAQIVHEKYLVRRLIGANYRVMEHAYDVRNSSGEILEHAEKEIFDVTEKRVTGSAQRLPDLIKEVFAKIEVGEGEALTGEPTGYLELDELTCGLQPAELIIIAGRPSMGKTAFGLNIAEHMAIVEHRPVIFFSLEMSRQQVAQRILCSRARVDSHALRRGRISSRDLEQLQHTAYQLTPAPLLVDDTSSLSILELRARARMAFRKHSVRAVFVDYLQLLRSPKSESRQLEVAEISRGLKALAKDLNVPVIAMAQLNRNTEDKSRQGNRPRMSDLRESGAIEQDADVVMLLHREAYYKMRAPEDGGAASNYGDDDENVAECIVAKQRNGPVDTIKLHFNRQWTRFDNHKPAYSG